MMAYAVVLIQPEGFKHAAALQEVAECVFYGLQELVLTCVWSVNKFLPDHVNIVIGGHLLDEGSIRLLPPHVILYNMEVVDSRSTLMSERYVHLLRRYPVWDYSEDNVAQLKEMGVTDARFVKLGYADRLTRIPYNENKDIDVLFYGSINEARGCILTELKRAGLVVKVLYGIYGDERDKLIARSKVILNMHFHKAQIFEMARVFYLLSNQQAVVAEINPETRIDEAIVEAVRGVPFDQLVDVTMALVQDAERRTALAKKGMEIMQRQRESAILAQALGRPLPAAFSFGNLPGTLNLGSGKDWHPQALNVDINPMWLPDIRVDFGRSLPFGEVAVAPRFGEFVWRENMFDTIVAHDVLEHIPDLTVAMSNCLRLLRPGGVMHIQVPYDLSLGAWQDPTHVRAFNENSWLYYTSWHWYLGWDEARFDIVSTLEFVPSAYGRQLHDRGVSIDDMARMPRAIDAMSITLRKRYLLQSERVMEQHVAQVRMRGGGKTEGLS
ncbi:MAG: methyltransferase domain-containing protein [Magnetococcales bacterium]|nr:methyltransferase domain-containing protein [Magnetococcales bacterium]